MHANNGRRTVFAAAVAAAVLCATPGAWAKDKGCGGGPCGPDEGRMEKMHGKMVKELGLSDEQSKQMDEHRERHMKAMRELGKEMRARRDALARELDKPDAGQAELERLAADVKETEAKMVDERIAGVTEVKKILTPEQYLKLCEHRDRMRERVMKKGGKGMRGMRGKGMGPDEMGPPPPDMTE